MVSNIYLAGVITIGGNMTSDIAKLCRGMGKPCVTGASGIEFDHNHVDQSGIETAIRCVYLGSGKPNDIIVRENDVVTLDGRLVVSNISLPHYY